MSKRCKTENCSKFAAGKTDYCVAHGGGKRCKTENCSKSAVGHKYRQKTTSFINCHRESN